MTETYTLTAIERSAIDSIRDQIKAKETDLMALKAALQGMLIMIGHQQKQMGTGIDSSLHFTEDFAAVVAEKKEEI